MLRAILRFGRCELDLARSELRVEGATVSIGRTPLRLLCYLALNRARTIPREELLREIWRGAHVSDAALHQALKHARRAVGDDGRAQRVIQNVHGSGYRFVAEVVESMGSSSLDVFIGRRELIARIDAQIAEVLEGRGRMLVLSGEPGIGKTRTAQEIAHRASVRGALVATGAASPQPGAPPLWPWLQVFRGLSVARPVQGLIEEAERIAPTLFAPAAHDREPPADAAAEQVERFRMFDAAARCLWRASEIGPLCILLDDLHEAEPTVIELCDFVARQVASHALLLVCTYRPDEALRSPDRAAALARLSALPDVHVHSLDGLPPPEAELLVSARVGEVLPNSATQLLAERSRGNPFYLIELARLFAGRPIAETGAAQAGWERRIPQGVRALLEQRFASLSPATRRLLRAAAAAGREASRSLLEAVEPEIDVAPGLAEACNASLLRELSSAGDRYGFSHELVREAVYDELGEDPEEQRRLHLRIAAAIEASTHDRLADIAHHLAAAAPLGPVDRAIDFLLRAGDRAREQHAVEEAMWSYRQALALLERWLPDARRLRCEALLALGEVELQRARFDQARGVLLEAAEIARAEGWPELLCRAALAHAYRSNIMALPDAQVVPLLADALDRVDAVAPPLRARLLARLALEVRYEPGGLPRAHALIDEAIALARRSHDPAALARVLEDASIVRWSVADPEGWIELNREIVHTAERTGDLDVLFRGLKGLATGFLEVGDRAAADREIEACRTLATQSPAPYLRAVTAGLLGARALLDADFEEAERRALEVAGMGVEGSTQLAAIQLLYHHLETGRTDGLEALLRSQIAGAPGIAGWQVALVRLLCQLGRRAEAAVEIEALGAVDAVPRDRNWLPMLAVLAECVFDLGDPERAKEVRGLLAPYGRVNAVHANGALFYGNTAHFLGLLSLTLGEIDAAEAQLRDALAMHERVRARAWALRTRLAQAKAGLVRGRSAHEAAAGHELADRVAAEARQLGMRALAEQADALASPP
jgi:DNA-binding winged helix-turn-helix (wHTH) protein/tetratricopeptide (TPR) repeat protein